jgi:hypothetical protein
MLDGDLIDSLSKNAIHELKLSDIESHGEEAWDLLCSILIGNNSLRSVSLCLNNDLMTHATDDMINFRQTQASKLINSLSGNDQLEKFELSLGYMFEEVIYAVSTLINKNKNMQILNLSSNKINGWHLNLLFPAIDQNQGIQSIDLSRNEICQDSIKTIKKITLGRKMARLDVSYNELRNSALQLLLMSSKNDFYKESIDFLNLSGNNINKFGLFNLHKKLSNPEKKIQLATLKLFLNDNPISCHGGKNLAKILKQGFEFDEIHLKNTKITDNIIVTICEAMVKRKGDKNETPIRVLNLEGLDINFNGAAAIANFIRKSIFLEKITLSYNRINASNKLIISESARYNTVLKELLFLHDELSINNHNKNKAAYFFGQNMLEIFKENCFIERVDFCKNWSSKESKIYSSIILENFNQLNDLLKSMSKQENKLLQKLNICNALINRIEGYYNVYNKKGPSDRIDLDKQKLFELKPMFENMKKLFKKYCKEISFFESFLKEKVRSAEHLLDRDNMNSMVHEFVGNRFDKVLLTNFLLYKSNGYTLLKNTDPNIIAFSRKNKYG